MITKYRLWQASMPLFLLLLSPSLPVLAHTILSVAGEQPSARTGTVTAVLGDIDGDGVPDFMVGNPTDTAVVNGVRRGKTGSATVISGQTGNILLRLYGEKAGDRFGSAVADAGDVNGDGVADFIVGASAASHTLSEKKTIKRTGSATLYSGATGTPIVRWYGDARGDQFGAAVAGAGDVNADGQPDIAIGAPRANNTGLAIVYTDIGLDTSKEAFRLYGNNRGDGTGSSLSRAGDINGDGFQDVVIGEPLADLLITQDGKKRVLRDAGRVRVISGADGSTLHTFHGENAGDRFGSAVAAGRDLDNDAGQKPDIAVGAPYYDAVNTKDAGRVYIYSGGDTGDAPFAVFTGTKTGGHFGTALAIVDDRSSDNIADIAISSPSAFISATQDARPIRDAGEVGVFSPAQGSETPAIYTLSGNRAGDHFGITLGSGADFNLDGQDDLLVGQNGVDFSSRNRGDRQQLNNAGLVEIVSGSTSGHPPVSAATGDLTTHMTVRQFPDNLVDVASARITRLVTDGQTAYAFAWNYFSDSKHYFKLTTSNDGIAWSNARKVTGINNTYQLAARAGKLVAIGCEAASGQSIVTVKQSADGMTWSTVDTPGTGVSYCMPSSYLIDVIGNNFVILDRKNCRTLVSDNALHWTANTLSASSQGVPSPLRCDIASGFKGTFVVQHGLVQINTQPDSGTPVYEARYAYSTSTDGTDWTTHVVSLDPHMAYVSKMAFFPDGQVQVYSQGTVTENGAQVIGGPKSIWQSSDLVNWPLSQGNISAELPYFSLYQTSGNNTSQAMLQGDFAYSCTNTDQGPPDHVLRQSLGSSENGVIFTDSVPFRTGGRFAAGYTCGPKAYLPNANRLILFGAKAPTATRYFPGGNFILSTD